MSADSLTVLKALDGKFLTKRHRRQRDGSFETEPYGRAFEVAVREVQVGNVVGLGQALEAISRDPHRCIIRGRPLLGIDRDRCRRLYLPHVEDDGGVTEPSFEPAARRWLALDFDGLPMPVWNPEDLARRRAAIARDRLEHPPQLPLKGPDDGEDYDVAADGDPAPIHCNDWPLLIRAAVSTLPPGFEPCDAWWQQTASAGLKPGIRLRLWYWLDRGVTDAECKRWLAGSPVDPAVLGCVQPIYTAAPIFRPAGADPIQRRSGMWWRWQPAVSVPQFPASPPPPPVVRRPLGASRDDALARRARGYAEAVLRNLAAVPAGQRHPAMRAGAIALYQLAGHGLLDPAEITRQLFAVGRGMGWPERRLTDLLDWASACAAANPDLPSGLKS